MYVHTYVCIYVICAYICTIDLKNFGVKILCKAHSYFNEIKTHEIFTMVIYF